jgi:hypothetical protein
VSVVSWRVGDGVGFREFNVFGIASVKYSIVKQLNVSHGLAVDSPTA